MNKYACLDHLILACPQLEQGIQWLYEQIGVKAILGGQHQGRGTHNALLALSPTTYLEIIAPDPTQAQCPSPLWLGADTVSQPTFTRWAAKSDKLPQLIHQAAQHHIELGAITSGGRQLPDGTDISWQFTDPLTSLGDGLVPFFLDWGNSQHPATGLPIDCQLSSLHVEHPNPDTIRQLYQHLELPIAVKAGDQPKIIVELEGPKGTIRLS